MLSLVQQCSTLGSAGTLAGMLAGRPEGAEDIVGTTLKVVSAELPACAADVEAAALLASEGGSLRPLALGLLRSDFLLFAAG